MLSRRRYAEGRCICGRDPEVAYVVGRVHAGPEVAPQKFPVATIPTLLLFLRPQFEDVPNRLLPVTVARAGKSSDTPSLPFPMAEFRLT